MIKTSSRQLHGFSQKRHDITLSLSLYNTHGATATTNIPRWTCTKFTSNQTQETCLPVKLTVIIKKVHASSHGGDPDIWTILFNKAFWF